MPACRAHESGSQARAPPGRCASPSTDAEAATVASQARPFGRPTPPARPPVHPTRSAPRDLLLPFAFAVAVAFLALAFAGRERPLGQFIYILPVALLLLRSVTAFIPDPRADRPCP